MPMMLYASKIAMDAPSRAEIEYPQRLKNGLRHAALKGLRPEKKPGLIRRSPLLTNVALFEGTVIPRRLWNMN